MRYAKGDRLRYEGADYLEIRVRRVAKDGTWIDIFVHDTRTRTSWTKRQRLPLPGRWATL